MKKRIGTVRLERLGSAAVRQSAGALFQEQMEAFLFNGGEPQALRSQRTVEASPKMVTLAPVTAQVSAIIPLTPCLARHNITRELPKEGMLWR
jgi:hypothetical protein